MERSELRTQLVDVISIPSDFMLRLQEDGQKDPFFRDKYTCIRVAPYGNFVPTDNRRPIVVISAGYSCWYERYGTNDINLKFNISKSWRLQNHSKLKNSASRNAVASQSLLEVGGHFDLRWYGENHDADDSRVRILLQKMFNFKSEGSTPMILSHEELAVLTLAFLRKGANNHCATQLDKAIPGLSALLFFEYFRHHLAQTVIQRHTWEKSKDIEFTSAPNPQIHAIHDAVKQVEDSAKEAIMSCKVLPKLFFA